VIYKSNNIVKNELNKLSNDELINNHEMSGNKEILINAMYPQNKIYIYAELEFVKKMMMQFWPLINCSCLCIKCV
jgi:hypothetical protein